MRPDETIGFVQEVFHHVDLDGTSRHFSVPLLRQLLRQHPESWTLTEIPIDRALARTIARDRGVESARMRSYPLSKLDEPGIACTFPDTSTLIVDGNHRLVKRARRGLTTMRLWVAPEAVWRQSLLDERDLIDISVRRP